MLQSIYKQYTHHTPVPCVWQRSTLLIHRQLALTQGLHNGPRLSSWASALTVAALPVSASMVTPKGKRNERNRLVVLLLAWWITRICFMLFLMLVHLLFRYVILVWQNGSNMLQHRQSLVNDVEQLLTWHQRCLEMPACLEQLNMMSTVLASYCGNCCRERSRLKLVNVAYIILCICWH